MSLQRGVNHRFTVAAIPTSLNVIPAEALLYMVALTRRSTPPSPRGRGSNSISQVLLKEDQTDVSFAYRQDKNG